MEVERRRGRSLNKRGLLSHWFSIPNLGSKSRLVFLIGKRKYRMGGKRAFQNGRLPVLSRIEKSCQFKEAAIA